MLSNEGLETHYIDLELTDMNSIVAARQKIQQEFGRLDILVNNAGNHYDQRNKIKDPAWVIVDETVEANFLGPCDRGYAASIKTVREWKGCQ
jgi:NADP-dependent 3-hydroxy acid dehydrogenase YdfG